MNLATNFLHKIQGSLTKNEDMVTLINPQREEYASPFGEKSSMFNSCFLRLASRNSKQRTQKISHRLLSNRDSDYFSRSMSIFREPDRLSNSFSSSGVAASFKKELANAAKRLNKTTLIHFSPDQLDKLSLQYATRHTQFIAEKEEIIKALSSKFKL